ncbi:MAG: hypothetical protein J7M24_02610, partial [Candidatus Latescibacteria bacterium]|nr:hypothetical protein [Candidatus Latescibacterota bacterium]
MKRRDILRMLPISIAGMTAASDATLAQEMARPLKNAHGRQPLSLKYQRIVREMLTKIRHTQSEDLLEASHAMARTIMRGGTCWANWDLGHSTRYDVIPGRNGLPEILTQGFSAKDVRDGDVYLVNRGDVPAELAASRDFVVIGAPSPWSSDAKMADLIVRDTAKQRVRPKADIWIETGVSTLGAVIHVPGMPAPTGPVSGIIGQTTMRMMLADACRILALNGKSVPVSGDEPKLAGDSVPWVSLHDPLMDDYFDRVLMQMEMIEAEMGSIRRIAKMAADSVLAGGKVYGYSWHQMGLCVEAQTRRGGLTLSRGVYAKDGKPVVYSGKPLQGSSKDLVIMGVFEPDNPTDLACLDAFRRMNMKVASIGPMTRDIAIPDGRTVPKESDVHVGRMCDTYGLYA